MKRLLTALAILLTATAFAQPAQTYQSGSNKVIRDYITQQQLATDSAFKWFAANQQGYTPEANALNALRQKKDSIHLIVFGGTWCHDTQFLLPKFFALTNAAGVSPDRITLFGVDESKKAAQHMSEAFNITRVPTFIVMKNGKEVGRVVEYGSKGLFDLDLGQVLSR